jgi:hypothetical protein
MVCAKITRMCAMWASVAAVTAVILMECCEVTVVVNDKLI